MVVVGRVDMVVINGKLVGTVCMIFREKIDEMLQK